MPFKDKLGIYIVGDGFRALKRVFGGNNLKSMDVAMIFPFANVRLETDMRLLNGDGRRRNGPAACTNIMVGYYNIVIIYPMIETLLIYQ